MCIRDSFGGFASKKIINLNPVTMKDQKHKKDASKNSNSILLGVDTLGVNVKIGKKTRLARNVIIGSNTTIGTNCQVGCNVIIGNNCRIPSNSIISAGVVIGNDCTFRKQINIGRNQVIPSGTICRSILILPDKTDF